MAGSQDDKVAMENSVRAAAIAAAKGVPLGEAILSKITTETNIPGLSVAERISRAVTLTEQFVASPKPLNEISATPAQLAALAKQEGVKGRLLIDGVTGYVDRDGRNADAKERRSSAEYDKLAGAAIDRATMAALLNEGFTKQQANDAAFTAQTLGWKDWQSVKNLAYAGKEFGSLAEQYERSRKDGDAAKMAATLQKMRDERDHAQGKKKEGMTGVIDKIEKLHGSAPTESIKTDHERATMNYGNRTADAAAIFNALKKQQARLKGPVQ